MIRLRDNDRRPAVHVRIRKKKKNGADECRVGGPGLDFETWVSPRKWVLTTLEHPGLKIETWATRSKCAYA
jgi:hypothetical protein